jgi:hypothetical protein
MVRLMTATVIVNGRIGSGRDAVVSVFDHGFLYGEGVYDDERRPEPLVYRDGVRTVIVDIVRNHPGSVNPGNQTGGVGRLKAAPTCGDPRGMWRPPLD